MCLTHTPARTGEHLKQVTIIVKKGIFKQNLPIFHIKKNLHYIADNECLPNWKNNKQINESLDIANVENVRFFYI